MTDDQRLALMVNNQVARNGVIDLGTDHWKLARPVHLNPPAAQDNVTVRIVGSGVWNQVQYSGEGACFQITDPKDCVFERVGIQCTGVGGSGWLFKAVGSAGRCRLSNLYVQGGLVAYDWQELSGGSDNWLCQQIYSNDSKTGVRIVGHNSVAPFIFDMAVMSGAETAFDLTQGGTGATLRQCGGSDTETVFRVSGGQSGRIEDAVTERAGTVLWLGDDSGSETFHFSASDCRDTRHALARIVKCGKVELKVDRFSGASLVECDNRSTTPLDLTLTGVPVSAVKNIGSGKVFCNGLQVAKGQ